MNAYRAKRSSRLSDRDAQVIGEFIEDRFEDGPVTPIALVKAATAKRSVIHGYFQWDDVKAGQEYRLWQARHYLGSIEVVRLVGKREEQTRAFHVVTNGDRAYVPEQVVWRTPAYREQVVERARRELESWQRRYDQYEELSGLRLAVSEALAA